MSTKIKLVYVIGTLQLGGAERQMIDTASRVSKKLFDVSIFCLFGGGPLQIIADQQQIEVTISPAARYYEKRYHPVLRIIQTLLALYRYLRWKQPDIVHCYMYKSHIYGGFMAKLQGKSKLVTHRLNLGYFKNMHLWYQLLENIVNCFTDCIVVNSGAVKQQVLRQERCLPRCIKVIYAGIDIDKFRPVPGLSAWPSIFQQKYGIPANSSIVAMIANLRFLKGYREFILAAADIHQQYPDVYFLCVGQNPLLCQDIQQELHALAQQLGIGPQLIFTGQVQNIPELLEMITIQVSASYEEGFSSAILEGMASEKPIVATAVGGTPEQLQHEHTGLLVPPRNTEALGRAVLRYLDKPEFARQIGRNARIYAEDHFALNKTIPQLEQLYLQLLHSSE